MNWNDLKKAERTLQRMIGGKCYMAVIVETTARVGNAAPVTGHLCEIYLKSVKRGEQPTLTHISAFDYDWFTLEGAEQWARACFTNIAIANAVGDVGKVWSAPRMNPEQA